jgi:hypothetical protein
MNVSKDYLYYAYKLITISLFTLSWIFLNIMIEERIVIKLIVGIMNITGTTLTPASAIPMILPERAVIKRDKKTK